MTHKKRKSLDTQEDNHSQHTGRGTLTTHGKSARGTRAARYNTWLLTKLTPKGIVFSFLFFSRVQGLQGRSCWQGCLPEVQAWTWPSVTKSAPGSLLSEHLLQKAATQLFRHMTFHHSCSDSRLITDPNIQRCVFHKLFGTASMQAFAQ